MTPTLASRVWSTQTVQFGPYLISYMSLRVASKEQKTSLMSTTTSTAIRRTEYLPSQISIWVSHCRTKVVDTKHSIGTTDRSVIVLLKTKVSTVFTCGSFPSTNYSRLLRTPTTSTLLFLTTQCLSHGSSVNTTMCTMAIHQVISTLPTKAGQSRGMVMPVKLWLRQVAWPTS